MIIYNLKQINLSISLLIGGILSGIFNIFGMQHIFLQFFYNFMFDSRNWLFLWSLHKPYPSVFIRALITFQSIYVCDINIYKMNQTSEFMNQTLNSHHPNLSPATVNININLLNRPTSEERLLLGQAKIEECCGGRSFRLNPLMDKFHTILHDFENSQVFLADFMNQTKLYLGTYPFVNNVLVDFDKIRKGSLQLDFKTIANPLSNASRNDFDTPTSKYKKIKERTIGEALQAVSQWETLYQMLDSKGKKLYNFHQASKIVGIAKKSLADYSKHLRLARQYGFNIQKFQSKKFGLLRKFLKDLKNKGENQALQQFSQFLNDNCIEQYLVDFTKL